MKENILAGLKTQYRYTEEFGGKQHRWFVSGEKIGIELRINENDKFGPSGGLECHYAITPPHMKGNSPHHPLCEVVGYRACWHDGSSMYATEYWIPMWEAAPHKHHEMFIELAHELKKRDGKAFNYKKEQDDA